MPKLRELAGEISNSFIPSQFTNPANPAIHEATTGPGIWKDTEGKVDILVAGVGTGGTVTGTGRYLKSQNPDVKVVAVEPAGSRFSPKVMQEPTRFRASARALFPIRLTRRCTTRSSLLLTRMRSKRVAKLAAKEGLLVGISSGAAVWAAGQLAQRPENKGKTIVAILPDTGERYLSTAMFKFE